MITLKEAFAPQLTDTDHKGDQSLYYLVLRPGGFEILRVRESEVDALEQTHELMDPPMADGANGLPRLQPKAST